LAGSRARIGVGSGPVRSFAVLGDTVLVALALIRVLWSEPEQISGSLTVAPEAGLASHEVGEFVVSLENVRDTAGVGPALGVAHRPDPGRVL
jgi:hypothetical protein